jgi:hypothetical protein
MTSRRARDPQDILGRIRRGTYVAGRLPPAGTAPPAPEKKRSSVPWRIYIGADFSINLGEGPFETKAAAVEFAENEVGIAWSVRRDGAVPTPTDRTWRPESEAQRRRRAAKWQAQVDENRRFSEAEQRFHREHPDATGEQYRKFLAEWSAPKKTRSGKR